MYLQETLAKSPRREAWMELIELITGLFLLAFLQFHMFAVSTIIVGPAAFNRDSAMLDEYYLSYIGIPLVILAILVHGLVALRKAPWRYKEMAIFIQHSRRLAHLDTWAWLVQILTGMAVLVLATIHTGCRHKPDQVAVFDGQGPRSYKHRPGQQSRHSLLSRVAEGPRPA